MSINEENFGWQHKVMAESLLLGVLAWHQWVLQSCNCSIIQNRICCQGFCSPACTSVPCGWNKSTKTIIEPKRLVTLLFEKKLGSKRGTPRSNREEVRMEELKRFDPREKLQQNMTDERMIVLINGVKSQILKPYFLSQLKECQLMQ